MTICRMVTFVHKSSREDANKERGNGMINKKRLRGLMAEEQVTYGMMSDYLGITAETLRSRINGEKLHLKDVQKICELLHIEDPRPIFFTDLASPQDA